MKTIISILCVAICAAAAHAEPTRYSIEAIGLDDAEHTRNADGYSYGGTNAAAEATAVYAAGINDRYDETDIKRGQSAWRYDGSNSTRIGLYDAYHTSSFGYQYSINKAVTDIGLVVGESWGYNGGNNSGGYSTIWVYDGNSTTNIGLTDYTHTYNHNNAGLHFSEFLAVNSAGQVLGQSKRYTLSSGKTPWLYTNGVTQLIGPTGAEYFATNNAYTAEALFLNDSSSVIGKAANYGSVSPGADIWLYSGGETTIIGPTDEEFHDSNGKQFDYAIALNNAGQVAGYSFRYANNNALLGRGPWLYGSSGFGLIGLTDAEHTRSTDGYRTQTPKLLNETGQVLGNAERYAADGSSNGYSTWFFDGAATTVIGLTDSEHTRGSDGYRNSNAVLLNDSGHAAGHALRYHPTIYGPRGQSAWYFDGNTSFNIGLIGPEHRGANYYNADKHSEVRAINAAGQVTGISQRYDANGAYLGQTAWLFDGTTTIPLDGFSQRPDGYAYSATTRLGEDGSVAGYYKKYDAAGTDLGTRAFIYTAAGELFSLDDLVVTGMQGWSYLASINGVNANGVIYGTGYLNDASGSRSGFILRPATVVVAEIDVIPSNAANEVDPASTGQIAVAVHTTSISAGDAADFDATQIDAASLKFGPGKALSMATPVASDVDGDSDIDVTFGFNIQDSGIVCDATEVSLTGETYSGDVFIGTDSIATINCDAGCHP